MDRAAKDSRLEALAWAIVEAVVVVNRFAKSSRLWVLDCATGKTVDVNRDSRKVHWKACKTYTRIPKMGQTVGSQKLTASSHFQLQDIPKRAQQRFEVWYIAMHLCSFVPHHVGSTSALRSKYSILMPQALSPRRATTVWVRWLGTLPNIPDNDDED